MSRIVQTLTPAITAFECSDDHLITRARSDPNAFAQLYDRYLPQVYRYLYAHAASAADAEDLTSQVFLTALEIFPRYQHQGSFKAWLLGIASRKAADYCREYYRRYRKHVPIENIAELPSLASSPLAKVIQAEQLHELARLVSSLDEDDQELLRLRFAARLSFSEIAEVLGKKEATVKMSLYRLLNRMEKKLEGGSHE